MHRVMGVILLSDSNDTLILERFIHCTHSPFLACCSLSYLLYFSLIGMSELAKERPPNPVEWLASYLIQHDPQRVGASKPAAAPR